MAENKGISAKIRERKERKPNYEIDEKNHSEFVERLTAIIGTGSVRQFALKAGLPPQTVTNILVNGSEPTRPTILAIANAAGVSIDWLLTGSTAASPPTMASDRRPTDEDLSMAMSCYVAVTELLQETGRDAPFEKKKQLAINMFRREAERRPILMADVAGAGHQAGHVGGRT